MIKFCYMFLTVLPLLVNGQAFPYLAIKAGLTVSDQIKTPKLLGEQGMQAGFAFFIEPTIFTFGSKKQFDVNVDFAFIQKNNGNREYIYAYGSNDPSGGQGEFGYRLSLNYLSITPTLKYTFWKSLFIKAGPRIDGFVSYRTKSISLNINPSRQKSDFSPYNLGITYAIGVRVGKRKQFVWELMGQNDFTQSAINYNTGQTYKNMSYMLNFGMILDLKRKNTATTQ